MVYGGPTLAREHGVVDKPIDEEDSSPVSSRPPGRHARPPACLVHFDGLACGFVEALLRAPVVVISANYCSIP